jgi:hypothetical protein
MQAYNERLYSPGGGGLIKNGEQPLPTTNEGIEAQYGTGRRGFATVRSGGPGFYPNRSMPPVVAPVVPVPITPPIVHPSEPPLATTGEGFEPTGNPHLAPVVPAPNPALANNVQSDLPSGGRQADIVARAGATGVHPVTGQPLPLTPEDQVADEKKEWIARGGSERTWDRNQAQAGVKPRIDARATQSPLNSTTSATIQAQWAKQRADRLATLKDAATN